jgi:hypothetical protein
MAAMASIAAIATINAMVSIVAIVAIEAIETKVKQKDDNLNKNLYLRSLFKVPKGLSILK